MAGNFTGVDIGRSLIRLAYRDAHGLRFVTRRLPENIITEDGVSSDKVMSDFLSQLRHEEGLHARDCVLVLSYEMALFRRISLPPMSVDELKINLPFEFRDYISDDPDAHVFDYAVDRMVTREDGTVERMDLFASTVHRNLLDDLVAIFHRAGLRLFIVAPKPIAYMRLLAQAGQAGGPSEQGSIVIVDVRYDRIDIALYDAGKFESSRVVYAGCVNIDEAIAEARGIDKHIAEHYRMSNFENVLDTPECSAVYERLVFEISKVVNFYNYSNPDQQIASIYLAGEGSAIPQLVEKVDQSFDYPVLPIGTMLGAEGSQQENASVCALAYAGLLLAEGKQNGN
jgi:type IV pilus assembly protein PilM